VEVALGPALNLTEASSERLANPRLAGAREEGRRRIFWWRDSLFHSRAGRKAKLAGPRKCVWPQLSRDADASESLMSQPKEPSRLNRSCHIRRRVKNSSQIPRCAPWTREDINVCVCQFDARLAMNWTFRSGHLLSRRKRAVQGVFLRAVEGSAEIVAGATTPRNRFQTCPRRRPASCEPAIPVEVDYPSTHSNRP